MISFVLLPEILRTAQLLFCLCTGTSVVSVRASDSDPSGGTFSFQIQNANPVNYFMVLTIGGIGVGTGVVTVATGQTPDREVSDSKFHGYGLSTLCITLGYGLYITFS